MLSVINNIISLALELYGLTQQKRVGLTCVCYLWNGPHREMPFSFYLWISCSPIRSPSNQYIWRLYLLWKVGIWAVENLNVTYQTWNVSSFPEDFCFCLHYLVCSLFTRFCSIVLHFHPSCSQSAGWGKERQAIAPRPPHWAEAPTVHHPNEVCDPGTSCVIALTCNPLSLRGSYKSSWTSQLMYY